MTNYINNAKQQFGNIILTENYRKKMFAKNFGSHLNQLFEVSEVLDDSDDSVFRNKDIVVTDRVYWQTEGMVLEQLDDVTDGTVLNQLDNLEDMLHENIKVAMGKNYERSSELNKIIDHTIHGILLSIKYNYFSEKDRYTNPWEDAKNILTENLVLFSFSADIDEMQQLGYTLPKNESAEIRQKKIGVIGRGNRPDYNFHYVRDLVGLRNTVVDILADADSHSNPFKTQQIIDELRKMGISKDELSDNNISNFLIAPLKRSGRIGSSNEGYFLLKNCGDVEISYKSHLETLRGFYNTLENHRQLAHRFGCTSDFFDDHRKIFKLGE